VGITGKKTKKKKPTKKEHHNGIKEPILGRAALRVKEKMGLKQMQQ